MTLSDREIEILSHTAYRAANQAFCGRADCDILNGLVGKGYLKGPIYVSFLPSTDAYFQLTSKGRKII